MRGTQSGNTAFGIYIHVPFCKSKCAYCAFSSITDMSLRQNYVKAVISEITSAPERGAPADTVYIGGGTPSCLHRGAIAELSAAVRDTFDVSSSAEITVEANPESCDAAFADECAEAGVNRISMGLQSADDNVLRAVGRIHTCADFVKAAELLVKNGFSNISSDVILGLPQQTAADVKNAVDAVSAYCTHASVYALSVEEGTALDKRGYTPDDDTVADMYDLARLELGKNGFSRYEVSNFARDGKYSRHNVKYWRCEPYIGFGAAAHGYDGGSVRYAHADDTAEYIADSARRVTALGDADMYNEYIMLALRTENGIGEDDFRRRFGYGFADANSALERLVSDGSIVISGGRYRIAPEKMFVMNGIVVELMK